MTRPALSSPSPPRRRRWAWGATPWLAAAVLAALLPGCPFFPENGCFIDRDCAQGYACDARTGQCVAMRPEGRSCQEPEDCTTNETCSRHGTCAPGDCTFSGCVEGYRCDGAEGVWACVVDGAGLGGSAGSPSAGSAGRSNSASRSN